MAAIRGAPKQALHYVAPQPEQEAPIKPERMGFSLFRPFIYSYHFIKGTVEHSLDGLGRWGRRGAFLGTVAAVAAPFFPGLALLTFGVVPELSLFSVAGGLVIGLLAGAAFGAAMGALTGGVHNVMHYSKREHMADTMAKNQEAAARPAVRRGPSTKDIVAASKQRARLEFDQQRDLNNELRAQHHQYRHEVRSDHVEREVVRRAEAHSQHGMFW